MTRIIIEGESVKEILQWPESDFDDLVLTDEPIVFVIGSAEVLGQFAVKDQVLIVELAQIDGGGEGVLPAVSIVAKHIAKLKGLSTISCIVHAIDCARPNLKLRAHLEKTGFVIEDMGEKGRAYHKQITVI